VDSLRRTTGRHVDGGGRPWPCTGPGAPYPAPYPECPHPAVPSDLRRWAISTEFTTPGKTTTDT